MQVCIRNPLATIPSANLSNSSSFGADCDLRIAVFKEHVKIPTLEVRLCSAYRPACAPVRVGQGLVEQLCVLTPVGLVKLDPPIVVANARGHTLDTLKHPFNKCLITRHARTHLLDNAACCCS